jgi:hypothetical protein
MNFGWRQNIATVKATEPILLGEFDNSCVEASRVRRHGRSGSIW